MKGYIAPDLTFTDLRADERVCTCSYEVGYCVDDNGEQTGYWHDLNS